MWKVSCFLLIILWLVVTSISVDAMVIYQAQIAWGQKTDITESSWTDIPIFNQDVIEGAMLNPHSYWVIGQYGIGFKTVAWESTADNPKTLQFFTDMYLPYNKWWELIRFRLYTKTDTANGLIYSPKSKASYWIVIIKDNVGRPQLLN